LLSPVVERTGHPRHESGRADLTMTFLERRMLISAPGQSQQAWPAVPARRLLFVGCVAEHDRFVRAVCAAGPCLDWLGTAAPELREACRRERPDIVVVDWDSPKPLSSCLVVGRTLPAATIFLLRCRDDDIDPDEWARFTGVADGVINCTHEPATTARVLAVSTETVEALQMAGRRPLAGSARAGLTGAEKAVLQCAAAGKTAQETAAQLRIEAGDVEAVLRTVKRKLDARSRAHAVALAVRAGLISL
jgi:DNA-binding CsgD family transcriptional regulator